MKDVEKHANRVVRLAQWRLLLRSILSLALLVLVVLVVLGVLGWTGTVDGDAMEQAWDAMRPFEQAVVGLLGAIAVGIWVKD